MKILLYDSLGTITDAHWGKEQLALPQALAQLGHEVIVVTGDCKLKKVPEKFSLVTTGRTRLTLVSLASETLGLLEILRREKPDALICHRRIPATLVSFIERSVGLFSSRERRAGRGRPLLILRSDFISEPARSPSEIIETLLLAVHVRAFDRLIVQTSCQARKLRWLRVKSPAIWLLPWGYDSSVPNDIGVARISERLPIILLVGRVTRQKAIEVLIRAFSKIHCNLPGWRLSIAGPITDPPYKAELLELASHLSCEQLVSFTGWLPKEALDELYRSSSLFCQPSKYEASPLVRIEALLHGVPMVIADTGCSVEWKARGAETFPVGDDTALSEILEKLALHPDLRERMVRRGSHQNLMSWGAAAAELQSRLESAALS